MIVIDGKEGGGQILRTAIGLSAATGKAVRVVNIRGARCTSGLMPQHLIGVKIAGEFCNAKTVGLRIGSNDVQFEPGRLAFADKKIEIGTAGSIPLLLQTLTPILILSDKQISLEITGGTDVPWSPGIFYFQHVFCDFMKKMGGDILVEILKHGFYPKGGGKVKITYNPSGGLNHICLTDRGNFLGADVWSIASEGLRKAKVAERQVEGAEKKMSKAFDKRDVGYVQSLSPGSSIHVHAQYQDCRIGAGSIGQRGKPAEEVGAEAATELEKSIRSGAPLDKYMADQILPYLALASGKSEVFVEKFTDHCIANVSVIEKILQVKFEVEGNKICVNGIGN
jgi:RNA 3'-phosphate cyclase